jgi:hypothetical protein
MIFVVLLFLIAALIKNGERIYALRLASVDGFRDHVAHPPNAGPDYPSFMKKAIEYLPKLPIHLY